MVILLSPFVPHVSEELWQQLGNKSSIFSAKWPEYNPALIKSDYITLPVQVNGRLRSKIEVPVDISDGDVKKKVLSDEKVKQWLGDKEIKKLIIVPNKLVNIVV